MNSNIYINLYNKIITNPLLLRNGVKFFTSALKNKKTHPIDKSGLYNDLEMDDNKYSVKYTSHCSSECEQYPIIKYNHCPVIGCNNGPFINYTYCPFIHCNYDNFVNYTHYPFINNETCPFVYYNSCPFI